MSVLAGVGILLLSMLIMALLQLSPSVLMLFLHYGRAKYSKIRTSDLALFYIFGVEVRTALIFVLLYYVVTAGLAHLPDIALTVVKYALINILAVIGLAFPFLYFRKGDGTRLFVSRKFANYLNDGVKKTKTRSDAFMLGMAAGLPELVLTIPLYILSIIIIADLGETAFARAAMILLFMIAAILPLFIVRLLFSHHINLANIQMFREKNKTFYGLMVGAIYILIALLMLLGIYK